MILVPDRLLDTSALAPEEREAATREFLETLTELDVMGHACPPEAICTSVRKWNLREFQLIVMDSPWLRFALNGRSTTEAVSFGAQLSGQTVKTIGEQRQVFNPGEVSLIDFSSPFEWCSAQEATTMSVRFTYAGLCLPAERIRSAAGDLTTSPLYELFRTHILQLHRFLEEDIPAAAANSLGSATQELARAVIATVGHEDV